MSGGSDLVKVTFRLGAAGRLVPLFDGKEAAVVSCAVTSGVKAPAIVRIDINLPGGVEIIPPPPAPEAEESAAIEPSTGQEGPESDQ